MKSLFPFRRTTLSGLLYPLPANILLDTQDLAIEVKNPQAEKKIHSIEISFFLTN
jgi:hypothetical protein